MPTPSEHPGRTGLQPAESPTSRGLETKGSRAPADLAGCGLEIRETAGGNAAPSATIWSPPAAAPRRSVFGNYRPEPAEEECSIPEQSPLPDPGSASEPPGDSAPVLARAFLYRYLARAYEDPTREGWDWLCSSTTRQNLAFAWELAPGRGPLPAFAPEAFETFRDAWLAAFGHAARGPCPINEIEYGDLKADPLFQPHRLADLAAFYRAFGLEMADDAGERHDHLCVELEFMCVLAAKEAWALEQHAGGEVLTTCRQAQRKFLREHLGRWTPAFTRRLERHAAGTPLAELARFTRAFIEAECARLGVPPGSEDLLLRPADAGAALCETCGLSPSLPGAVASSP